MHTRIALNGVCGQMQEALIVSSATNATFVPSSINSSRLVVSIIPPSLHPSIPSILLISTRPSTALGPPPPPALPCLPITHATPTGPSYPPRTMPSVLLFSGLPLDVREADLAPTRLPASSVAVTALYNQHGTFLGTFLVEVGSDGEAERVRRQFSGQVIDGCELWALFSLRALTSVSGEALDSGPLSSLSLSPSPPPFSRTTPLVIAPVSSPSPCTPTRSARCTCPLHPLATPLHRYTATLPLRLPVLLPPPTPASHSPLTPAHTLAVHHVLPSTAEHPSAAPPRALIPPFGAQPAPKPSVKGRITPAMPAPVAAKPRAKPAPKGQSQSQSQSQEERAPGLKLLSRLGKGGKAGEKERQKQLLEKQRKAVAKSNPGEVLLLRLAKPAKGSPAAKKAAAHVQSKKAGAKGADKVSRAKKAAAKPAAMDVDKAPKPKPQEKPKPKTQTELDEEMKAYERQRRFA
ncbi:unnamed protein product [Cutaneotrichosporon oleaginosum]